MPFDTYCAGRGFDSVPEYVAEGRSGAKDPRPQLNKLVDDARKRQFDAIVSAVPPLGRDLMRQRVRARVRNAREWQEAGQPKTVLQASPAANPKG